MNTADAFADFRRYPLISALTAVQALAERVQVHWADGRSSPFHHQWLRDNCPCPQCVYSVTREPRFRLMQRLDPGELWCFDNRRTLHARNAFDPGAAIAVASLLAITPALLPQTKKAPIKP